ncbi:restriction endonuclease subunit S domain-containing protein [Arthrobacter subterraneus]|uniref:hypothetical protein n=1 Tax=Arthrobacter subterraneus TaxID=335973 RepID=UPI003814E76D
MAQVQSGLTARERLDSASGECLAIQMADIAGDRSLDLSRLAKISGAHPRYEVVQGDVLFRSRGFGTTAWAVPNGLPGPAIAVLPLFIIRPITDKYESEFLAWWLNQPEAQRHMRRAAQGQTIQMVSKPALESTPVYLPPISVQRRIVSSAGLATREAQLMHRLADCQLALHEARLTNAAISQEESTR